MYVLSTCISSSLYRLMSSVFCNSPRKECHLVKGSCVLSVYVLLGLLVARMHFSVMY